MAEPDHAGPSRTQKRWSGRLRTAGALLALLGAVATADRIVGLARADDSDLAPTRPGSAPLPIGIGTLVLGGSLYALGRKWGPR